MNNKPIIISGEASETESEDENVTINSKIFATTSIQGAVITGEDSESENENDASIASAVSALKQSNIVYEPNKNCDHDSLLHQKLRECNGKLRCDVENFCQNVYGEAIKNLNGIDQQLIKSQLTLQGAVTSLKSLGANSLSLKNKLESLLSANFFNNVKVDK